MVPGLPGQLLHRDRQLPGRLPVPRPGPRRPCEPQPVPPVLPQLQVHRDGGPRKEPVLLAVLPDVATRLAPHPQPHRPPRRPHVPACRVVDLRPGHVDLDPPTPIPARRRFVAAAVGQTQPPRVVRVASTRRVEAGQERRVPVPLHRLGEPVRYSGDPFARQGARSGPGSARAGTGQAFPPGDSRLSAEGRSSSPAPGHGEWPCPDRIPTCRSPRSPSLPLLFDEAS